jgi:hypothetical protein
MARSAQLGQRGLQLRKVASHQPSASAAGDYVAQGGVDSLRCLGGAESLGGVTQELAIEVEGCV